MGKIKPSRSTPAQKRNTIVRWIFYFVVIFICTVVLTVGRSMKPLLLIPVALCIASNVKEGAAGFIGILCGLLLDVCCQRLLGYHAILLLLVCIITSWLYTHYLQQRLWNMLLLTLVVSLLEATIDFFFSYVIWDYEHVSQVFLYNKLPVCAYTLLAALPIYGVFHFVHERLLPNSNRTIEQAIHTTIEPY
jgi:rod shape-determining protein MreD